MTLKTVDCINAEVILAMKTFTALRSAEKPYKLIVIATLLVMIFAITVELTVADETTERSDGIIIEDAVITPVKVGETAYLRFKITNFGLRSTTLQSVRSNISSAVKMVMTIPGKGSHIVSDLVILQEETLNLASSHIRVEFQDVNKTIEPGTNIEFELKFWDSKITAFAHAH